MNLKINDQKVNFEEITEIIIDEKEDEMIVNYFKPDYFTEIKGLEKSKIKIKHSAIDFFKNFFKQNKNTYY